MSGLLQRLARQAIGRASRQVHSIKRLPFAAATSIEAELHDAGPPELVMRPDLSSASSSADPTRSSSVVPGITDAERVTPTVTDAGDAPKPTEYERTEPRTPGPVNPSIEEMSSASRQARAERPSDASDAVPSDDAPPVRVEVHAATPPAPASSPAIAPHPVVGTPQAEPAPGADRRTGIDNPVRPLTAEIPAPLLAPVAPDAGPRAAPSRRDREAGTRRDTAISDTPDEVHVHIGRVEITAVREPAPAKPRTRTPGIQPMSLQDYLARRDRSRK